MRRTTGACSAERPLKPVDRLSPAEARRIAIAAQGLTMPRPRGEPVRANLKKVLDHVGLIQIDSVNVLARSHYLPVFARLGAYPRSLLEDAAWGSRRMLFEYWGHEASLIPTGMQPLFRWRMEDARAGVGQWGGVRKFGEENQPFIQAVLKEVEKRGPISSGELEDGGKAQGGWWGWSNGKRAMEWLFWAGLITTRTRRGFERLYDIPERVLPRAVMAAPTPGRADAQRELIRIAARSLGVGTETDLRDYFRMGPQETRDRIAELVEAGELSPVEVKGWGKTAYLAAGAKKPGKVAPSTLLSPFDSLDWRRERAERMFGFHYRIEIYVPADKRKHGYYVLPWLHGDGLKARVDLKSDRQGGRLLVQSAHAEDHAKPDEIAASLRADLEAMAAWLGLEAVEVRGRGKLAEALKAQSPA
jgi:uncharacterized protein YcaQ